MMKTNQHSATQTQCAVAGSADVVGCRLSLYPMQDAFASQILSAVKKVDTSEVWNQTDLFSTLYRGELESVLDSSRASFIHAYQENIHMVSECTFSRGCPGDTEADTYLTDTPKTPNQQSKEKGDFPVSCKFSFYAFGDSQYMDKIEQIVQLAEEKGLNPTSAHYVTIIEGTANQLFDYFEEVIRFGRQFIPHFVIQATLSINSPSLIQTKGEKNA